MAVPSDGEVEIERISGKQHFTYIDHFLLKYKQILVKFTIISKGQRKP